MVGHVTQLIDQLRHPDGRASLCSCARLTTQAPVTSFPFNVSTHPMYDGSSLNFLATALWFVGPRWAAADVAGTARRRASC